MPKLEMFEIEEREVYTEVEITEEQAKEYKEWQENGAESNDWEPEWVDEIDWDEGEKTWRDGDTSVVHVEVIDG